jgi:hypothetical protein
VHARLITAQVQPSKMAEFEAAFGEEVLPGIGGERGFKSTYVMKDAARSRITAVVFLETESDAQAGSDGYLRHHLPLLRRYLTGQPTVESLQVIFRA